MDDRRKKFEAVLDLDLCDYVIPLMKRDFGFSKVVASREVGLLLFENLMEILYNHNGNIKLEEVASEFPWILKSYLEKLILDNYFF